MDVRILKTLIRILCCWIKCGEFQKTNVAIKKIILASINDKYEWSQCELHLDMNRNSMHYTWHVCLCECLQK